MAALVDKEKVRRLLSNGAKPAQVADMLGCTPSYISQLMEDQDFRESVNNSVLIKADKYQEHDDLLDKIEDKVLRNLDTSLSMCYKPEVLLRALQVVNKADRRAVAGSLSNNGGQGQVVVNLQLPKVMINQLTLNSQGSVVQVGERELITLDKNSFQKLANEHVSNVAQLEGVLYDDSREAR